MNIIKNNISIQALYDYKLDKDGKEKDTRTEFQFKHCTIIRNNLNTDPSLVNAISIQALYDYKKFTSVELAY